MRRNLVANGCKRARRGAKTGTADSGWRWGMRLEAIDQRGFVERSELCAVRSGLVLCILRDVQPTRCGWNVL